MVKKLHYNVYQAFLRLLLFKCLNGQPIRVFGLGVGVSGLGYRVGFDRKSLGLGLGLGHTVRKSNKRRILCFSFVIFKKIKKKSWVRVQPLATLCVCSAGIAFFFRLPNVSKRLSRGTHTTKSSGLSR